MVAYLFFHSCWGLCLWLAGWFVDRISLTGGQFIAVRDACSNDTSSHNPEIRTSCNCCRLCGFSFPSGLLSLIAAVVMTYQSVGTLGEWAINGDFMLACQDFRIGIPGMLLQIFGGWAVIRWWKL